MKKLMQFLGHEGMPIFAAGAAITVLSSFNNLASLMSAPTPDAARQGAQCEETIKKSDGKEHCTPEVYKKLVVKKNLENDYKNGAALTLLGIGLMGAAGVPRRKDPNPGA
jgi:hypothetical protein